MSSLIANNKKSEILSNILGIVIAIKKHLPFAGDDISLSVDRCVLAIESENLLNINSELLFLSNIICNGDSYRDYSPLFFDLISKISIFDSKLLSSRDSESLLLMKDKVKSTKAIDEKIILDLIDIISNIADNSKILSSESVGKSSLKKGRFQKGTDDISQSDIAVATRKIVRELGSLSNSFFRENFNGSDFSFIIGRISELKLSSSTSFFESLDILSELTMLIVKSNLRRSDREKSDLLSIANKFKFLASSVHDSDILNGKIKDSLISFESEFNDQIRKIENIGNNSNSLFDLKEQILKTVQSMQEETLKFSKSQGDLISDQSKIIKSQSETISKNISDLESAKKSLCRIKEISNIDSLSQLGNRRSYNENILKIESIWNFSDSNVVFGLALIDIDFFKKINDEYGHLIGDKIINWVGKVLRHFINKYPNLSAYRYGGEEFALISEGYSHKELIKICGLIKSVFEKKSYIHLGEEISITTSMGISFFKNKGDTGDKVFSGSDKALYRAKENGRNQIWVSGLNDKNN